MNAASSLDSTPLVVSSGVSSLIPVLISLISPRSNPARTIVVTLLFLLSAAGILAAPPAYDHVVIVIEENEHYEAVIGNPAAPFINSLAANGVGFTNMHAIVHPSQPNYLELFSGSNQGIIDDNPVGAKFTTPNLGAALIAAGKTFTAYADGLPTAGDINSDGVNNYAQRHCPWVCWMPSGTTLGPNQIPRSLHKPFTAFPNNYTQLPTVSFVIPNNVHNMHSGTIAAADLWLQNALSGYAEWAKTHNSLLVVTWDEDSFQQANRIPTMFYGANLVGFPNQGSWSLHNLLRLLEDMYGLPHSGRASLVPPIRGSFTGEFATITKKFSSSGPSVGTIHDTMITSSAPDDSFGGSDSLKVESSASAGTSQTLIKFNDIFGPANTQIPSNANIISAKLIATSTTAGTSFGTVSLHRMLIPWSVASTFNGLGGGVQADDIEAVAAAEFTAVPSWPRTAVVFDATESLRQFLSGAPNQGWLLRSSSADTWLAYSSESAVFPPILEVTYAVNESVGFDQPEYVVTPGGIEAHVVVHHFGAAANSFTVNYSTNDLTATAGSDYNAASGTLSWAAGDLSPRELVITIIPDVVVEGNETFRLSLSNIVGAAEFDANATAVVAISEPPFDVWRFGFFGAAANDAQGQPYADPDDDSRTNFVEYMYAADPTSIDPISPAPTAPMVGDRLRFSFRQSRLATDLVFKVQISDDLVNWTDGCIFSPSGNIYFTPVMNYNSSETFPDYYLRRVDSAQPSATGRVFMRLSVTNTP